MTSESSPCPELFYLRLQLSSLEEKFSKLISELSETNRKLDELIVLLRELLEKEKHLKA